MDKFINAKEAIKLFNANALGGQKIPHGVSNPVFHKSENGEYLISAFIFLYNAEEIRNKSVKRPAKWMTMDIRTGEIISEYDCREKDFCDVSFETYCDLNPASDTKYSAEYTNQTLAIFDLIIKKYIMTGRFDKELNDAYMYMMLNMVSVGFKEFYKELNNV